MAVLNHYLGVQRSLCDRFDRLCRRFDRHLPEYFTMGGYRDYSQSLLPKYLPHNARIYDLGSGKIPCLDPETRNRLAATVVGLDIDSRETARAPEGSYDTVLQADVTRYLGGGDADVVLCRALLEHVRDMEGTFAAISSLLRPGGVALLFVPSRNAIFARMNLKIVKMVKVW
jgi:2-polyprenyl-6-hydroxyphenyl methylase/3-demethylubiquinone-9 3-methyltransferase